MSGNLYPPEQIYVRVYTPYGETKQKADVYILIEDTYYQKVHTPEGLSVPEMIDGLIKPRGSLPRSSDGDQMYVGATGDVPMIPLTEYVTNNGHSNLPADLQENLRIIAPLGSGTKSALRF